MLKLVSNSLRWKVMFKFWQVEGVLGGTRGALEESTLLMFSKSWSLDTISYSRLESVLTVDRKDRIETQSLIVNSLHKESLTKE